MRKQIVLLMATVFITTGCAGDTGVTTEPVPEVTAMTESSSEAEITLSDTTSATQDEPAEEILQVYVMPTEKGGQPEYLPPDPALQKELAAMLADPENRQLIDHAIWQGANEYGFGIYYEGYHYEFGTENLIAARPEESEDEHFQFENEALSAAVKDYVSAQAGISVFSPDEISGIVSAELVYKDHQSGERICSERILDRERIGVIEEWMAQAVQINGGSACSFSDCELKLEQADGQILTLAMASDSCNMYFVDGRYFQYREVSDNGPFYAMFTDHPIIRAWRNMNYESVSDGVAMTVKEASITPQSITLLLYNGTNLNIEYGDEYYLEYLSGGSWHRQPYIVENPAFHDLAYTLTAGKPAEVIVDWSQLYGTVADGEYRIVKTILDFRGTGDYDTYELNAEFTIKDSQYYSSS